MIIYSRILIVFSSHNLLLLHPYLLALWPLHSAGQQIGYIGRAARRIVCIDTRYDKLSSARRRDGWRALIDCDREEKGFIFKQRGILRGLRRHFLRARVACVVRDVSRSFSFGILYIQYTSYNRIKSQWNKAKQRTNKLPMINFIDIKLVNAPHRAQNYG